jgi:hypothetical protein
MSDEKDVPSMLKAKFDRLPAGTVLVLPTSCPTCGCANRGGIEQICRCKCHGGKFFEEEVGVNDPKWTGFALYTEEDVIGEYVRSEGYLNFTYVCRKLKLKPAECAERVLAFIKVQEDADGHAESAFVNYLKATVERLTDEGWEPGTPPAQPMKQG